MAEHFRAHNSDVSITFDETAITTREQAEDFCDRFHSAMTNLVHIIEKETHLLQEGLLSRLPEVAPQKTAAIESYMSGIRLARDNAIALGNLAPEAIQQMKERHGSIRPILQTNLTVVSTARSVTDNVIETVAKAVGSQFKTNTYTAHGIQNNPQNSARGIAVNRSL